MVSPDLCRTVDKQNVHSRYNLHKSVKEVQVFRHCMANMDDDSNKQLFTISQVLVT